VVARLVQLPKSGTLEKKDRVKSASMKAAKFAPMEQFCLSPHADSTPRRGNMTSERGAWAKLRMIKELAD